ncbi:MAG: DoxX family membrane protein [Symbiobacteriia bacterium]
MAPGAWQGGKPPVRRAPWSETMFETTRYSWLWLILRVYLGWQWLHAGWEKLGNPAWVSTGTALQGYWTNAVKTTPKPAITYDWYRAFIEFMLAHGYFTWFAKLVVGAEILVGIFLILGAFTGVSAFIGGFLNFNYMMAGTASTNPLLFTISVLLIMAWKVAGYFGLDAVLLPSIRTPWDRGSTATAPPQDRRRNR